MFDVNNIRYLTSTKIGEWERDKLSRWALLTRGGDPILWDFGSAAVHHKLYSPWLKPENCKAGLVGLRGTVDPAVRPDEAPRRGDRLDPARAAGVAKMPIGVDIIEPPMMFELEKAGLKVKDGQQVMLEAREIKSADEIALLNRAAAMVDGAYHLINEQLQARACARTTSSPRSTSSSTRTAPTTWRRSTPSPASAATRIRTTSPTA